MMAIAGYTTTRLMSRTRPPLVCRQAIRVLAIPVVCGWCSSAAAATSSAGHDAELRAPVARFNTVNTIVFTGDVRFARDFDSKCRSVSQLGAGLNSCSITGARSLITRMTMTFRWSDSRRQLRRAGFTARAEHRDLALPPHRAQGERRVHGQREFRQTEFDNRHSGHFRFR